MSLWEIIDRAVEASGVKPSYVQGARRPGGSWLIVTWTRPFGRRIVLLRSDDNHTHVTSTMGVVKRASFHRADDEHIGEWIAREVLA